MNNNNVYKLKEFLREKGISEEEYAPFFNETENGYGLKWEDREENVFNQLLRNLPILKESKDKAIVSNKEDKANLLIEGDNLHSLMALQYTHKGLIDVIILDPPYNTGNKDFKYNDKFVDKEDTWRHSNWLSFMNKRLILAEKLLSEKGIVFINIDDNEVAQLKLLCDDIFGENNKLGIISVVNNLKGRSDDKFFATSNEFMLVYAKNIETAVINGFPMSEDYQKEYKFKDEISNYKEVLLRKTGKNSKREDRPNMYYPIYFNTETKAISLNPSNNPYEIEILPLDDNGNEGCWRWGMDTFNKKKDTEIVIKLNSRNKWNVYVKMRDIVDGKERTQKPKTTWINPKYDSGNGTSLIKEMFNNENVFTNPKPLDFILDILRISSNKNAVILDFFAGSGTTGHAVLELNKEDGGNRQFILCTNNESNICEEVTYQRLNKVINGYITSKEKAVDGLGGNLNYFKVHLEEKQNYLPKDIKNLINKCTGIISVKEGCYNLLESNTEYDIISNNNKVILIHKVSSAFDYEVEDVASALDKYDFETKIVYTTKSTMKIKGILINEYPKEIIELISQNKKIK